MWVVGVVVVAGVVGFEWGLWGGLELKLDMLEFIMLIIKNIIDITI